MPATAVLSLVRSCGLHSPHRIDCAKPRFSKHTRNYQQQSAGPLPAELYAVLGMERVEKTVLGVELHGDLVRRDVPQTTVSFCNQRLACLTDSEQATRRELIQRGLLIR